MKGFLLIALSIGLLSPIREINAGDLGSADLPKIIEAYPQSSDKYIEKLLESKKNEFILRCSPGKSYIKYRQPKCKVVLK